MILENWRLVEADLLQVLHIDVWDDDLMRSRPWVWLSRRVASLLDCPPVSLVRYESGETQKFAAIPATRLGYLLNPPKFE